MKPRVCTQRTSCCSGHMRMEVQLFAAGSTSCHGLSSVRGPFHDGVSVHVTDRTQRAQQAAMNHDLELERRTISQCSSVLTLAFSLAQFPQPQPGAEATDLRGIPREGHSALDKATGIEVWAVRTRLNANRDPAVVGP